MAQRLDLIFSAEDYKKDAITNHGRDDDGWLDPVGGYWPVASEEHHAFAEWWVKNHFGEIKKDPVDFLEEIGWVHISTGAIYLKKKPNQRQMDQLYDWMEKHGTKIWFDDIRKDLNAQEFLDAYY